MRAVLVVPFVLVVWMAAFARGAAQAPEPAGGKALRFARVFGDGMVLQREKPVAVFGFAKPDAEVEVVLGREGRLDRKDVVRARGAADDSGRWRVTLPPLEASAEPRVLVVRAGTAQARLADVLVGEVWLCSGQSNMRWPVRADTEWSLEKRSADTPDVRYAALGRWARAPLRDLPERVTWRRLAAGGERLDETSAVSYWFAVRLHRYLGVPVGIVHNAIGGSLAESWTSRATLEGIAECRPFLEDFARRAAQWPAERARRLAAWKKAAADARREGRSPPRRPRLTDPRDDRNRPSACYDGLIAPIAGLTVRGVLFFQGENNAIGRWNAYRACLPALIGDWRSAFEDSILPFGIVSLQGFGPHGLEQDAEAVDLPPGTFWYAAIRDAQLRTYLATPRTGLIVTFDAGDTADIHPRRKRAVGVRAARWALAEVYAAPVVHRGPLYRESKVVGRRMLLRFEPDPLARRVAGAKPGRPVWWLDYPITRTGKEYRGFVIAGKDRVFRPAHVRRAPEPGWLEVWSDLVPAPVAVRYGWAGYPAGNAIGHEWLPVAPFRTDDWPLAPDAPFDPAQRRAWNERLAEMRRLASRRAELRRLREARDRLQRLRRMAERAAPAAREAIQAEVGRAEAALERLGQRLEVLLGR